MSWHLIISHRRPCFSRAKSSNLKYGGVEALRVTIDRRAHDRLERSLGVKLPRIVEKTVHKVDEIDGRKNASKRLKSFDLIVEISANMKVWARFCLESG